MLYYIHGYESNPDGTKGKLFNEKLKAKAIKYRECNPEDIVIKDCLKKITEEIIDDNDIILIGSSLGGFFAVKTAFNTQNVKKIILLNPALIPPSIDINNIHNMPKKILRDMQDKRIFEEKINTDIIIIIGTKDEIIPLDWILEFAKIQETTINFLIDDHRCTRNIKVLPDIINDYLGYIH